MSVPSVSPQWWGSCAWKFLHSVAFNYPTNPSQHEREEYKKFFSSLENVLPCEGCREHLRKFRARKPINLDSRDKLTRWVYDAQNSVNRRQGNPSPTYSQVARAYAGGLDMDKFNAMSSKAQRAFLADPYYVSRMNGATGGAEGEDGAAKAPCYTGPIIIALLAAGLGYFAWQYTRGRQVTSSRKKPEETTAP